LPAERAARIDGNAIAAAIRAEVAEGVARLSARGVVPGLSVVLVGDDPASTVYVGAKERDAREAGMQGGTIRLPADTPQAELLALVDRLNADPAVHGILVQMPLPPQIDPQAVIERIRPDKDVDGFHPENAGKLFIGRTDGFVPCTPAGVIELLRRSEVDTRGAEVCIVGRSTIVGRPMAALFLRQGAGGDATVTICHSRTRDLVAHVSRADIVVAAIGRPEMITGEMLKPGAVVIDVGINRIDDPSTKTGTRLVGDVHFPSAELVASKITPVPGGVGPMTRAMLLVNTLRAAEQSAASGA
jgi:methylenetetrahydrofolate dehydrogenase (NADP+)/methenyltetrahydrofolate cyclohydrolase